MKNYEYLNLFSLCQESEELWIDPQSSSELTSVSRSQKLQPARKKCPNALRVATHRQSQNAVGIDERVLPRRNWGTNQSDIVTNECNKMLISMRKRKANVHVNSLMEFSFAAQTSQKKTCALHGKSWPKSPYSLQALIVQDKGLSQSSCAPNVAVWWLWGTSLQASPAKRPSSASEYFQSDFESCQEK